MGDAWLWLGYLGLLVAWLKAIYAETSLRRQAPENGTDVPDAYRSWPDGDPYEGR